MGLGSVGQGAADALPDLSDTQVIIRTTPGQAADLENQITYR
jgi:Cu/Ag efflux pump CusA